MTETNLEHFLVGNSKHQYLVTAFKYDVRKKSVQLTFTSVNEQSARTAKFNEVTQFVEETYEDFDGSTEWTIIGFHASRIRGDAWKIVLQCLEKGFFFNAQWPHIVSTTVCP